MSAQEHTNQLLSSLPLVTFYLTDRCNSRCVSCDYWRHGRTDVTLDSITRLLPELTRLGTRDVLLSGGEPLLHPQWALITERLRSNGQQVWLLTSGLSLAKHARRAAELFDHITVSLDGSDATTYTAIRGLDAFDIVCDGIRAVAQAGTAAGLRITLQRANFRQLPAFIDLAKKLGACSISFLTVDVANPHAFARVGEFAADLALDAGDLAEFDSIVSQVAHDYQDDFKSGFIAESASKLRRHHQYFAAVRGLANYPPVRCNAPEFSAVIDAAGRINPCFFIPGTVDAQLPRSAADTELTSALNCGSMAALRDQIRRGDRRECKTCVCSLWREPGRPAVGATPTGAIAGARGGA